MSTAEKIAFFFGTCLPIIPVWYAGTSSAWSRDGDPGILGPRFRGAAHLPRDHRAGPAHLAHVGAALASITSVLLLAWIPWNLGLLIAGADRHGRGRRDRTPDDAARRTPRRAAS
jgi:hypothetical protein